MRANTALKLLFGSIFCALLAATGYASLKQPLWQYTGLTRGSDRYWNLATLADAYGGFLTFSAWVFYKEARALTRLVWFVLIMLLGNMAMSFYMLLELSRLPAGEPVANILKRRS